MVSDIPAGDGKTANLFLQCISTKYPLQSCVAGEVTSQLHTEEGLSMSSLALPLSGLVLGATGLLVAALVLRIYLRRREDGELAPGE